MCIFKKKKICVTHDSTFHTDDIFTTATLFILNNGNIKIIRTRDKNIFAKADYLYDVGGEYNPDENKFDHHQKGRPERENGAPYSSFGLVWKKFGEQICGEKEVAEKIENKIVKPIDMVDNGVIVSVPVFKNIFPYSIESISKINFPTWREKDVDVNKLFKKEVKNAVRLLKREIKIAKDDLEGEKIILDRYNKTEDKRIIILDINMPRYLYQNFLCRYSEPLYIILPGKDSSNWKVEAIRVNENTMESRKYFPESWKGVLDKEKLREISGISDIEFCHNSGFLCETKSKEGAILLANKVLIS